MADKEPEGEAPYRRRRNHTPWIVGAGIVLLLVVFGLWRYYAVRESTDDAQIDGHLTPIAARVGGTVVGVKAVENRAVEAGEMLVQIETRDYQVALDRARADLARAQAESEAARIDVPLTTTNTSSAQQSTASEQGEAEAELRSAQAGIREAEAKDTKATEDLRRAQQLLDKDEVSRQEFETMSVAAATAKAAHESAVAAVRQAEQKVAGTVSRVKQAATAPQQVAITRAKAASAEARVQEARAAVARAELDLEHTSVTAPVAGIVSRKSVEVGQVVQAGQPLLAVVPLDDVWVTANFKENQLRSLRPGQAVTIRVDAYGGRRYRGHVDSLSPATGARFSLLPPENASGNYVKVVQRVPVKIVLEAGENDDRLLRPGLSVEPTVYLR